MLYFQLREIYFAKYFLRLVLLFAHSFLRRNITTDRNKFRRLRRVQSHARGLIHRELDDSLLHADYFHRIKYFRLNAARLRCIKYIRFVDSIFRTTYFHLDLAASNNKAKCSSSNSQLLFTFAIPKYSGALPLQYYSKYTQHWGLCHYFVTTNTLDYLVKFFSSLDISTSAKWIYFRLNGIIFFGSMDSSSSAYWILFHRIHLIRFIYMNITGLLLYNITRGVSGHWIFHRGLLLDLFSSADSSSILLDSLVQWINLLWLLLELFSSDQWIHPLWYQRIHLLWVLLDSSGQWIHPLWYRWIYLQYMLYI